MFKAILLLTFLAACADRANCFAKDVSDILLSCMIHDTAIYAHPIKGFVVRKSGAIN